ncbi:MAG TPA: hypothetical protein VI316_06350 [Candidatus Dormibacteraeota bacterium]
MPSSARLRGTVAAAVAAYLLAGCGMRAEPPNAGSASTAASTSASSTTTSASSTTTAGAAGRIHIVASRGPTCPVQRAEGPPCVAPYQGPLQVVAVSGAVVATVTTSAVGTADLSLPAGTYTVTAPPASGGLPRLTQPATVTVSPGATVTASLSFDTGIR